ncbi:MAG: hypothetical protein N4A31_01750 [Rickettsiales bacterium]|jgi:hypothetical protein|nr:hypothetical protein [Rickettsiales bacterium]
MNICSSHKAKHFAGVLGVVAPFMLDIGIISCYTTDNRCFWINNEEPEETLDYLKEIVGEVTLGITTGFFVGASLPIMYYSGRIAYSEMLLIHREGYDEIV